MSCFALINAFSMFFTVYFSYHIYKERDKESKDIRARISRFIFSLKVLFWRFRHMMYRFARKFALHISILVLGLSMYLLSIYNYNQWEGVAVLVNQKEKVDYSEILYPNDTTTYLSSELKNKFSEKIVGVNYKKGNNWYKDNYVLTRKELEKDFNKMKSLNINTIKYQESRIYDRNVLNISKEKNIEVVYSFWVSEKLDFVEDDKKLKKLTNKILSKVKYLRNKENIPAWNIGNDVWTNLKKYYLPNELDIQRKNYLLWLQNIVAEIRKIDSSKVVSLDVEVSSESIHLVNKLSWMVPEIDVFGLILKDKEYLNDFLEYSKRNQVSYMFNDIKPEDLKLLNEFGEKNLFIRNWQDQYENDLISFDGLLNKNSNFNIDNYSAFNNYFNKEQTTVEFPKIRLVKPAVPLYENRLVNFKAAYFDGFKWQYPELMPLENITFEWNLIKLDKYGYPLAIKYLGNDVTVRFRIPKNYDNHRLNLILKKGDYSHSELFKMNIPIQEKTVPEN
jgi:hypothetical protein